MEVDNEKAGVVNLFFSLVKYFIIKLTGCVYEYKMSNITDLIFLFVSESKGEKNIQLD